MINFTPPPLIKDKGKKHPIQTKDYLIFPIIDSVCLNTTISQAFQNSETKLLMSIWVDPERQYRGSREFIYSIQFQYHFYFCVGDMTTCQIFTFMFAWNVFWTPLSFCSSIRGSQIRIEIKYPFLCYPYFFGRMGDESHFPLSPSIKKRTNLGVKK